MKIIDELKKRCLERGETFSYDVSQTREQFKRCMSECKNASLTMKTASGIKRFQENKGYGKWFNCLLPLVQSRVSCQPEQAVDPSSVIKKRKLSITSESSDGISHRSISPLSISETAETEGADDKDVSEKDEIKTPADHAQGKSGRKEGEQMFVPVKKRKSAKLTEFEETVKKTLQKATESLENDKMGELLKFFERRTCQAT